MSQLDFLFFLAVPISCLLGHCLVTLVFGSLWGSSIIYNNCSFLTVPFFYPGYSNSQRASSLSFTACFSYLFVQVHSPFLPAPLVCVWVCAVSTCLHVPFGGVLSLCSPLCETGSLTEPLTHLVRLGVQTIPSPNDTGSPLFSASQGWDYVWALPHPAF